MYAAEDVEEIMKAQNGTLSNSHTHKGAQKDALQRGRRVTVRKGRKNTGIIK
jgi:hypothetical protein